MKKLLVAGIAAAALYSAPALAGPPPAAFNWSGFYIGGNGGGMDFTTQGNNISVPGLFFQTNRKEVGIGGIHGGYQGQWGNLVVGIEGAWEGMLGDKYGSRPGDLLAGTPCSLTAGFQCQARINDILSVGPRVGFAMGQWMVYGTGGYARAMVESRRINPAGAAFNDESGHNDGSYYGGGLEMFVANGFTVGAEYKHFDFKRTVPGFIGTPGGDVEALKAKADTVLLRLTIKQ